MSNGFNNTTANATLNAASHAVSQSRASGDERGTFAINLTEVDCRILTHAVQCVAATNDALADLAKDEDTITALNMSGWGGLDDLRFVMMDAADCYDGKLRISVLAFCPEENGGFGDAGLSILAKLFGELSAVGDVLSGMGICDSMDRVDECGNNGVEVVISPSDISAAAEMISAIVQLCKQKLHPNIYVLSDPE